MDDPPYCGGFACCRDVTPSVFPHMTFLLDGVNLTIAGDAYVLLASVGYGGRVDGDAVRRLKEAFDMPFSMHLCEVCRSHIRVSRAVSVFLVLFRRTQGLV